MPLKNRSLKSIARSIAQQIDLAFIRTSDKPYLVERDGILALHFDERSIQSEMCIDNPDRLVVGYTLTAMSFLLIQPFPERIAIIGLGGGSLSKYCYRYLPSTKITAIEINPEVIALRNEFAIPGDDDRFRILLDDGAKWVARTTWRPDILIVDGFDASGLPRQLGSQAFYDACRNALADNGLLVANLWGGYPRYDEYLARIRNSFSGNLVIIDADDSVNKIVIAAKRNDFPPPAATLRRNARELCLSHPENFHDRCEKLIRTLAP